jgi:hypothetical protein
MAEKLQSLDIESKETTNEMNKIRLASYKKDMALSKKASKQRRIADVIDTLSRVLALDSTLVTFDTRKIVNRKMDEFVNALKVV